MHVSQNNYLFIFVCLQIVEVPKSRDGFALERRELVALTCVGVSREKVEKRHTLVRAAGSRHGARQRQR